MARGLKFQIEEVERLYNPISEKKGTDQLHGYREADLRLCFRMCKNLVFSRRGSYAVGHRIISTKIVIQLIQEGHFPVAS